MNKLFGIMKRTTLVVVLALVSGTVSADTFYWETAAGTTNSWFNLNNWSTNVLPSPVDSVALEGACYINSGSNVVVDQLANFAYWQNGKEFTLDIEPGAELSVSNYCRVGNQYVDATINVRGRMNVVNANNTSFALAGYRVGLTNNTGIVNVDGGVLEFGAGTGTSPLLLGGSSTGIVEVTNGGLFVCHPSLQVGSGADVQSHGTLIVQDGICTNFGGVSLANGSAGTGNLIINGGRFDSMHTGDACITVGRAGVGYMEVNGGEFVGRHAFNDENSNANRSTLNVGSSTGSTGTLVQNGGVIEVVGVSLGGTSGGTGNAIISNGLFKAMSNNGSWPCYKIYNGCTLTIDGGEFNCYTNGSSGWIYDGGTLEFKAGKLSTRSTGMTLFTESNSTIRIVGPKCDIDVGWWRNTWPTEGAAGSTLELILTQDAGHLSVMKSPNANYDTALPGYLDVGFAGGACMLSTNKFACMRAGRYLSTTYVDPTAYGLDLWDTYRTGVYANDELYIELKDSASKGTVSLSGSAYASFSPTSYGYVDVENLNVGTLPELTVIMTMTAGAKTLDAVVQDLQSAGYTNSVVTDSSTIAMKIPADDIAADNETFAWDFRELDGTVNATVSAVAFDFNPKGTVLLMQ